MNFTAKTEKEIAEENLLPAGIYDFEVVSGEDKTSKAGNEMIALKLKVFDADGNGRLVDDYLMEKIAYKLRHAAVACGLEEKYSTGTLMASDFVNQMGKLKLRIDKDKTGQYPDKNVVADYVKPAAAGEAAALPVIDDDIPF